MNAKKGLFGLARVFALAALIVPATDVGAQNFGGDQGKARTRHGQTPRQAESIGVFSTFGTDPASVRGGLGATPGAGASNINDYLFQDEQLNLDANAGNVRVLRTNEKAALNDYVTAQFPLKNINPRELRGPIRVILGMEGGTAEVIRDQKTGENYLQVIAPTFVLPYLERAVRTLDVPWLREYDTGSSDVYYKAKNRNVADVDFIASDYASSDNSAGGSVIDTTNNALSRLDEPYRIERYLKGAKLVDIPANQVLLEVKIYEVASINDSKIGLDYIAWKNGPGRNLFSFVFETAKAKSKNDAFTSIFDPFVHPGAAGLSPTTDNLKLRTDFQQNSRSVNYLLPSSFIDFLEVRGEASLVHSETLQVKSANTATIFANNELVALVSGPADLDTVFGDTEAGITVETAFRLSEDLGGNTITILNPDGTTQDVEVTAITHVDSNRTLNNSTVGQTGIFLEVTPFIGLETMELVIQTCVNDLNGITPNGQPLIASREITTTVRLYDGEPYVIAHLSTSHDIKESAKAPWLGDLPILGYLFGGETDTKRKTDVIVTVTPHFHLSSQTDLGLTASAQATIGDATGSAELDIPNSPVGYDQWLLGDAGIAL